MPSRYHDDWLSGYLQFTEGTEAPQDFHFWVGVWTLGGALRRKVFIDMGHFQWIPNFYIFLVAPPGIISKSTTLNIGASMLREIDGIKFGPESLTWQALVEALAQAREEIPMQLNGEQVFFPMSCLSIAAGELGTLISPANGEMMDALVSLWDGKVGAWEKWTKTAGRDLIINPYINIASCTTPSWLAQNFPEQLVGGGFTSRCLFVYGDVKRHLIAYPTEYLPPDFREARRKLVHDLERISTLAGEVRMTEDALEFGREWYAKHYTEETKVELDRFAGYRARKQTHMHKLAIILSASQRDDLVIDAKILQRAVALLDRLEPSMKKVFESIGLADAGRRLLSILQPLSLHQSLSKTALFQYVCFKMTADEFDQTVIAAQRAGLVQLSANASDVYIKLTAKGSNANPG